jgi:hypothetical protein
VADGGGLENRYGGNLIVGSNPTPSARLIIFGRRRRGALGSTQSGHAVGVGGTERTVPRLDEATSAAVGKVSEALEWVERARGALYEFHQLSGRADRLLGEAIEALTAAGHPRAAAELRRELYGRNVLDGKWTFQVVEEYDETYYRPFVAADERVRVQFTDGRRHVHEARMKAAERAAASRDPWGPGA